MSYTFSVASPSPPDLRQLLDSLGLPDLRLEQELPAGERFPSGYWRVYRAGLSTRSLELSYDQGKLHARLMICSSPDVATLALDLCERLAAQVGTTVEPEDGDPWLPGARPERFARDWPDQDFEHYARFVATMVERESPPSPLTMSGPRRPFHIGPRLLGELRAAGPEAQFPYHLLETMRRVQYADTEAYYAARILSVQDKDTGKEKFSLAVWGPGTAYLFPRVTYYAVTDGDASIRVPIEAGPAIAGARHQWLDEHQCLIAATPDAEWPALVARAREHAVTP